MDEARYPRRRRAQVQPLSPSKGWSEFELERTGSRHGRTREVSYTQSRQNEAELTAALDQEQAARKRLEQRQEQLKQAARQMMGIVDQVKGDLNQQVVSTLQHALLELLEDEDVPEPPAEDDVGGASGESGASGEPGTSGEQGASGESVLFESAVHVSGTAGRVVLGADVLLWGKEAALEPTVTVELATVSKVSRKCVRLSPFTCAERCTVESTQSVYFDFSSGAEGRELCELFTATVEEAVAAAKAAAALTTADPAVAVNPAAADLDDPGVADHPAAATATKERPLTARQRVGAELRMKLQEVVRLRSQKKVNEAAAALDAIPDGKMTTGAKGRARELVGTTFTFGGLALTKDIVARFLRSPEVRLLLPEEFQKKKQRAKDAEVEKRLLEAAKSFFCDLMKVKGKTGGQ
jgi:uncharacterized FlaG/YvyC family protein